MLFYSTNIHFFLNRNVFIYKNNKKYYEKNK